jgi:uncharacterized protein YecE (DUF72 family)
MVEVRKTGECALSKIRIGIGGWTFEPWRGVFYPDGLAQKRELEYASHRLSSISIEINGTFYGSQKPESFRKWHDETPDDFVFSLKGPRFATNRRVLAEAGESIERFAASGIAELKDKLGPINWQLAHTKKFDPEDFGAFLALLPKGLRHAVEVRHPTFATPECADLARKYGIALVYAGDSDYPEIDEPTAPFVYARIMGTHADHPLGYDAAALDRWCERMRGWADGGRDVFFYVISGAKEKNPAAAMALIERIK